MKSPSLEFIIRDAHPEDAPCLARYNQQLAKETEGKELDTDIILAGVSGGLQRPDRCRYFVAHLNEEIIGQAMITFEWSDWRNGELWWLQSVFVDPEYRRCGVFTGLYRHIEKLARENSLVRGLRLYIEEGNGPGKGVYTHLGMTHAGYHVYETEF